MASELKVEVIKEETIRPSSPTPRHLKTTTLSVFDQLSPDVYIPLLLFYPNNITVHELNDIDLSSLVAERSKLLKTSLAEALTHFYPFAGKFKCNVSISCNDHGVAFSEAQVNCPMSRILDKPDAGILKQLLPVGLQTTQVETGHLLLVKANFFECGGLVIGVSSSHIIIDAYTLSTFIQCWAAIALIRSTKTIGHHLLPSVKFGTTASLFPPLDVLINSPQPAMESPKEQCVTRRIVFDASNVSALKSKAASATVPDPTRVEVVSALIWKCAVEASRSNLGVVKPSVWSPLVNIRKILLQPMEENLMGNLVGRFAVKIETSEAMNIDVQSLVSKLRKGVGEFKGKYGNGVSGGEARAFHEAYWNLLKRDDVETFNCSSWCRFPFYSANFGWGKPAWVSQRIEFKNLIVLMDTRDEDGIEVALTLKEEDMAVFESNKELLKYASFNPTLI